jgi:hypothetical protein
MGDYEEAKQPAANTSTTDPVTPQRKPSPKGSDGSKPSARRLGERPRPKKPGALSEAQHGAVGTTFEHDHPTGIDGVDLGGLGHCATTNETGCFLNALQRTELNSLTRTRIGGAAKNYGTALTELRLEQMIRKVDELPWYLTLLLGACCTALESVAGMAVKALKKSGATTAAIAEINKDTTASISGELAEAVEEANREGSELAKTAANEVGREAATVAEKEMLTLSEKEVESFVKGSVDIGKEKASAGLGAVTSKDSAEANEKAQAMNYADLLGNRADVMFDQLSRDVGTVSDAAALAIWHSLDPEKHETAMYRAKLGAALQRYLESSVSKIGREIGFEGKQRVEKEIRIAKVLVPGAGLRYAYMDRVFDGWYRDQQIKDPGAVERSGAYDSSRNALSLQQEAEWNIHGQEQSRREMPIGQDRMLNFVEPEFQQLAVQKQKEVWLDEPEVFQMTYVHGRPALVKVAGS